jgi:hypothetical protein
MSMAASSSSSNLSSCSPSWAAARGSANLRGLTDWQRGWAGEGGSVWVCVFGMTGGGEKHCRGRKGCRQRCQAQQAGCAAARLPHCPSLAHLAAINGAWAPPWPRTASASWGSLELARYSWHSSCRLIF